MDGPQTYALASHLSDLLTGHPIDRLDVPSDRWQANVLLLNCVGQVMQRIRSHGRWLLFDFSHGISWACHLLAKSSWRLHSPARNDAGEPASASSRTALLSITLRNGASAALLGHPLFLILPTESIFEHPQLKSLGPDPLTTPSFADEFPPRLRSAAARTLAAALVDQELLAGAGNALKCEILFSARLHPSTRVASLLASQVDALGTLIPELFRRHAAHHALAFDPAASASGPSRRDQHAVLYQVYDRTHDPCHRCQTPIVVDHSSSDGRWTWYCPVCQPVVAQAPTLFT